MQREIMMVDYDKEIVEILLKKNLTPDEMLSELIEFNNSVKIIPFNKDMEGGE
jgi:hypothetical protein